MKLYWLFQRQKDGLWDSIEDTEWEKLQGEVVIAGRTHLVEARNLALALATVLPVEEVIRRAFSDVQKQGDEYAHKKWFNSSEDNRREVKISANRTY